MSPIDPHADTVAYYDLDCGLNILVAPGDWRTRIRGWGAGGGASGRLCRPLGRRVATVSVSAKTSAAAGNTLARTRKPIGRVYCLSTLRRKGNSRTLSSTTAN